MSGPARAACWFTGLATLLVVLRVFSDLLGGPPITSLDGTTSWIDRAGPSTVAVWLLRSAAEAALWYVLVVSVLHAASAATRSAAGARLADAMGFAGTSRLVRAGLGAGLAASTTISFIPAGASSEPGEPGTAVMRPLDDRSTQPPSAPVAAPVPLESTHDEPTGQSPAPPSLYTVEPGDSLWVIARDVLQDEWQRAPTDREIDPYWRALMETNGARFVTGDPDLILPNQVFELPPVPPPA